MKRFIRVRKLGMGIVLSFLCLTVFTSTAFADPIGIRALILGDPGFSDASVLNAILADIIGTDSRFDQANSASLNLQLGLPTLGTLLNYDSVLVFPDSFTADLTALSDLLGVYVDEGGGVVLTTFWGQAFAWLDPDFDPGKMNSPGYNPLTAPTDPAFFPGELGAFDADDPLMQGVTSLSAGNYRSDYFGDLDNGATVAAWWNDGSPLAAYNANRNVVAITLFPNAYDDFYHLEGDHNRLFANGLAMAARTQTAVPEPASLTLLISGLGLLVAARRGSTSFRRRGAVQGK